MTLSTVCLTDKCPFKGTTIEKHQESRCYPAFPAILYCRPPGFTVVSPGKYLAGGLQSGRTANLTDAQYELTYELTYPFSKGGIFTEKPVKCY